MLEVLEALILYLKLEGVDKERRVVKDVDCCDIYGCHAYFSRLTLYQNLKMPRHRSPGNSYLLTRTRSPP